MKNYTSDVMEAIELVQEEIGKENSRILREGGEQMSKGNKEIARKALNFADKLQAFSAKVTQLKEAWAILQAELDAAAPEVQKIVLPTKARKSKGGYTRKVEHVSPKRNFRVRFPDGTVIEDKKAKKVFAQAIVKLGVQAVADLKLLVASEPLVSRDKSLFAKQPTQVEAIAGGWFVKTHSSTSQKIDILKKIATVLNQNLTCELI